MKRVLLIGNYTFENRGDLAILHGLKTALEAQKVNWDIDITSCFYQFASAVSPISCIEDVVSNTFERPKGDLLSKLRYNYFDLWTLNAILKSVQSGKKIKLSKRFKKAAFFLDSYDAIVLVGGSYLIDLYGAHKFITLAISLSLQKPVYLAGHSIGPFVGNKKVEALARGLLPFAKGIYIRDELSLEHALSIGLKESSVELMADTAWLLPEARFSERVEKVLKLIQKPKIAITARELGYFAERLGVKQLDFELSFAALLDELIQKGYHIIGLSMAIPAKGSNYLDDRLVAARIKKHLKDPGGMTVVESPVDHLEIGAILSKCVLLIGTRLHSVILSMRYGTPAIALYYEHKSLGILKKMDLEEYSIMISDLENKEIRTVISQILLDQDIARRKNNLAVTKERDLAQSMVKKLALSINEL